MVIQGGWGYRIHIQGWVMTGHDNVEMQKSTLIIKASAIFETNEFHVITVIT